MKMILFWFKKNRPLWNDWYFIFLQLKNLKLWQYRNRRNIFYHQGREKVFLAIRSSGKVILIYGGREKVIWAGGRKKGKYGHGPGSRAEEM